MWLEILLLLFTLIVLLYKYVTKKFDHWQKTGVSFSKPSFPFGSYNLLSSKKHMNEFILDDYKRFKDEKVYGWFLLGKPILMINDVELIKTIKVKDFNYFTDAQDEHSATVQRTGGHLDTLFNSHIGLARGEEWKDIRSTFSPIFTSGKMKGMMKFILKVSVSLITELGEKARGGGEFETKEVFGKFSLDALASCAFGIDGQSFTNDDAPFVKHAKAIFSQDPVGGLLIVLKFIPGVAKIYKALNINVQNPKSVKFFRDIVLQNLKHRRESKERRNDLIDLMLDCIKEEGSIEEEEDDDQYHQDMKFKHKKIKKLDEMAIVSNAIILLVVGYDTTGMTLAYLSYDLATHPQAQDKLRDEVDRAFEEADGDFPDYNTVQSLPYLDMVIYETLRLHSPAPLSIRACTQDYKLPGTDITLRRNESVSFPGHGLHADSR